MPDAGANRSSTERTIISRFLHLLSAQTVDGALSALFFIFLARWDAMAFGEVMYGMAGGAIVMKVVQFGLYYPLVSQLGSCDRESSPEILNRVNAIKLLLLAPVMAVVAGLALYRHLSFQMAFILFSICLGSALEGLADTFFADLRVKGRQDREAVIRIVSSVASYAFGFGAAFAGMSPLLVGQFKLVAGVVKLLYGGALYLKEYSANWFARPSAHGTWSMFRIASLFATIEILGIIYNKTNIFFLESGVGVKGVAIYSATWNIVDPISILATQQLLGWVIFPLLSTLWWKNRPYVGPLVRRNAQWLTAIALPIMFVLHTESRTIIETLYPPEYADAIWMQQLLAWTILISVLHNLFAYVMMVAGAAPTLLVFSVATTVVNLSLNYFLVGSYGLLGGCLVIILTKLFNLFMTSSYCQIKYRFFRFSHFFFPLVLSLVSVALFVALKPIVGLAIKPLLDLGIKPVVGLHISVALTLAFYGAVLWRFGVRFLGRLPRTEEESLAPQSGQSG